MLGVYRYIQVLLALMIPCGLLVSKCMSLLVLTTVSISSQEAATVHRFNATLAS